MFKICIDIGGTFTDSIVIDAGGNISEYKVPTTPHDFSQGFINTLKEAAAAHKIPFLKFMEQIELIVHGTTVATNALVTRNVARTAMITTKGFRDIIEMRRALKIETKSMYEAYIPPYQPIVPRYLRYTVSEETRYTGDVVKPLNVRELKEVITRLKQEKVEAIAICFINSYANPENEKKAAQICAQELEGVFVTYSSEILPKMGEYERESTCVINASVGPVVKKYMSNLEKRLEKAGFKNQLLIVQADQFTQSVSAITRKPVYLFGSGPAAAPPAAAYLGESINARNIITADMGGTTLDAALVKNGEVTLQAGRWFNDDKIGVKVADVTSIGAGGGSIAWIDSLGLLRVGPQSATSEPGPACYGKGGTEPTVTDAAVILGYLPTDFFCGGKIPLDKELAENAVKKIAATMKVSTEQAAQAIFDIVNVNMADEITRISTKRGYDIRDFSLLVCGGGGAMCGAFWAEILGCKNAIVPNYASSFCAWGMFTLDIGRDYLRSYICKLKEADTDRINSLYKDMFEEARVDLSAFNAATEDLIPVRSADLRYEGQYHEVEIELPSGELKNRDLDKIAEKFHEKHQELYTFTLPWVPIEIRNLRMIVKVKGKKTELKQITGGAKDAHKALKRHRLCYFENDYVETPVFDSEKLEAGNIIDGPAVIEVPTTTAVIPRHFRCEVDKYNNYIMTRRP